MKNTHHKELYSLQAGIVLAMILTGCTESQEEPSALSASNAPKIVNAISDNKILLAAAEEEDEQEDSSVTQATVVTKKNVTPQQEGEDWPHFLGPEHNGVSSETGFAESWPEGGPPVLWEKKTGTGYSSPSIVGDQLILFHRIGNEEVIDSLNPDTGEPNWNYRYPSRYRDPYGYNNGPRCTPVIDNGLCFTYGAEGKIYCIDMKTGEKVWMRDIMTDFEIPPWFFGIGSTPIVENGKLIVMVGGQPNSGIVAFDTKTGKTLWESVGRDTWDGAETDWPGGKKYQWTGEEMVISYASPIPATIHGKRHILCLTRQGLVSVNPDNGDVNFKYWFRSRVHESVNASCPIVIDDQIFVSSAYKVGAALLKVNPDGKGFEEVWRDRRAMEAHWSTPIHVDGYIYGFSGRHEHMSDLRCLDLKTGEVKWSTNGFEGDVSEVRQNRATGKLFHAKTGEPVHFYGRGSKIKVEDKFIVFGERGLLSLVKINPEKYEEISRATYKQIHYPSWPAPVLSKKRLYLRCEDMILCLNLASQK